MDKTLLRNTINNQIKQGDTVKIKLFGQPEQTIKVKDIKVGRGKGGLARVVTSEQGITFGTSDSERIMSITLNSGEVLGEQDERDFDPKHLIKSEELGKKLKGKLSVLLNKPVENKTIILKSKLPMFNGSFKLLSAGSIKGRYGQIILKLEDTETGKTFELWSHRHATVIENLEIVEA
jgi:hypothetical protein